MIPRESKRGRLPQAKTRKSAASVQESQALAKRGELIERVVKACRRREAEAKVKQESPDREAQDAVTSTDEWVRVLDVSVRKQGEAAAEGKKAQMPGHLCLDGLFLPLVRQIALAVEHGWPCLVEGDCATFKTTAILWLANLCGAKVYRLQADGKEDAREWLGRWELGAGGKERLEGGCIVKAMREGAWVVLEDVNLASRQVLDGLLPVLEDGWVGEVSEGAGGVFGGKGDGSRHPLFRIFATIKPAEYPGRVPLPGSFYDRWKLCVHAEKPRVEDDSRYLRFLVTGRTEDFVWKGKKWRVAGGAPFFDLGEPLGEKEMGRLERLALFHSRMQEIGGPESSDEFLERKNGAVYTRRALFCAMELASLSSWGMAWDAAVLDAVREVYFSRLRTPGMRVKANALLRACGLEIGRGERWMH